MLLPVASNVTVDSCISFTEVDIQIDSPVTKTGNMALENCNMATENSYISTENGYMVTDISTGNGYMLTENCNLATENDHITKANGHIATENGYMATENSYISTENGYMVTNISTGNGYMLTENCNLATENDHITTANGHVATENGYMATENSYISTENGYMVTDISSGNSYMLTENCNLATLNGHITTANGHIVTENGYMATENGNLVTEIDCIATGGYMSTEHGNVTKANGCIATENGYMAIDSGNQATDNGYKITENDNLATENSNLPINNGNLVSENGDLVTNSGNLAMDFSHELLQPEGDSSPNSPHCVMNDNVSADVDTPMCGKSNSNIRTANLDKQNGNFQVHCEDVLPKNTVNDESVTLDQDNLNVIRNCQSHLSKHTTDVKHCEQDTDLSVKEPDMDNAYANPNCDYKMCPETLRLCRNDLKPTDVLEIGVEGKNSKVCDKKHSKILELSTNGSNEVLHVAVRITEGRLCQDDDDHVDAEICLFVGSIRQLSYSGNRMGKGSTKKHEIHKTATFFGNNLNGGLSDEQKSNAEADVGKVDHQGCLNGKKPSDSSRSKLAQPGFLQLDHDNAPSVSLMNHSSASPFKRPTKKEITTTTACVTTTTAKTTATADRNKNMLNNLSTVLKDCKRSIFGSSTVAIDNKIEQAMDLVKSHLMFAVREEVDVLKEQIRDLVERMSQLEYENGILRAAATPETLALLAQPRQPPPPSSS